MKWIWTKEAQAPSFAEFTLPFSWEGKPLTLKISAEYRYVAYVNGQFVCNGQYTDTPFYKVYDEVDITKYLQAGENTLLVQAFSMGIDGQVVWADKPCVAFRVVRSKI